MGINPGGAGKELLTISGENVQAALVAANVVSLQNRGNWNKFFLFLLKSCGCLL